MIIFKGIKLEIGDKLYIEPPCCKYVIGRVYTVTKHSKIVNTVYGTILTGLVNDLNEYEVARNITKIT